MFLFHKETIFAKFLWGNVLFGGKLQLGAKKSNFEMLESALNIKSVSMPLNLQNISYFHKKIRYSLNLAYLSHCCTISTEGGGYHPSIDFCCKASDSCDFMIFVLKDRYESCLSIDTKTAPVALFWRHNDVFMTPESWKTRFYGFWIKIGKISDIRQKSKKYAILMRILANLERKWLL